VTVADTPRTRQPGSWGWSIAHLAAPSARLVEADGERALALTVSGDSVSPSAYWSPLRAAMDWGGGTATFDGTLRMLRGFTVQGRLTARDADAVAMARSLRQAWATLVQAGRVAADLDVELALGADDGPPLDVQGTISIGGLWLAGDDPTAFAVGAHAVDLTLAPVAAPTGRTGAAAPAELRLARAVVASPYVKLIRTPAGWSSAAALETAPQDDAQPPPPAVVVDEVSVRHGTLQIADEAAAPGLALDLQEVSGSLRGVHGSPAGVAEVELQAMDAQLGALRLSWARDADALRADVAMPDFALAAAAPFFERAGLPWAFEHGRGGVRSVVLMGGGGWTADTTVTLREPAVGGDQTMLQRALGMAPASALGAVHDRHGEIVLRFPLASGRAGDSGGLTEAFAAGVRDALARPRWTPLPEEGVAIAFVPGMTELAPDAERRLATIADIMAARPDAVLELRGVISRADRRWFAEQAVAEDEAAEPGGFSVLLRAVGVRDQRMRIREALAARAAGEPGPLRPDDEAALSALVARRPPVPDDRLVALAAARTSHVESLLAGRHRVSVVRVVPADPATPERAAAVVDARLLPTPGTGPR
jgi:hypothetical protein